MPSASVVVVRPPGLAVTFAPAIGSPSLASVTLPVDEPARDVLVAEGAVRVDERLRGTRTGGHRRRSAFSMPIPAVAAVTRARPGWGRRGGRSGRLSHSLISNETWVGRADDLHRVVLDDERPVRARADRRVVDRRGGVDREVLPERVDRRVRRRRRGDRRREEVELVGPEEVHVAVVGQEDLGVGLAVELEVERQAQAAGELVAVQRRLGPGVDPVERDRAAAVAEVVELAEEREVLGDVLVDEVDVGGALLRAAAGRRRAACSRRSAARGE